MEYTQTVERKSVSVEYVKYTYSKPRTEHFRFYSDIFCPMCGSAGIWIGGFGDYYEGEDHVCVKCKSYFTMPSYGEANEVLVENLRKETPNEHLG